MTYQIPDSEDVDWQRDMLSGMQEGIEALFENLSMDDEEIYDDVMARLAALREYTGS